MGGVLESAVEGFEEGEKNRIEGRWSIDLAAAVERLDGGAAKGEERGRGICQDAWTEAVARRKGCGESRAAANTDPRVLSSAVRCWCSGGSDRRGPG